MKIKTIIVTFTEREYHVWRFDHDGKLINLVLGSQQMSTFPNPEPKPGDKCKLQWLKFGGYNGWVYSGIS